MHIGKRVGMAKPISDTGWQQAGHIIETPTGPAGQIIPATGHEDRPCFTCRSWDKDERKLRQFLAAQGMEPDAEGRYEMRLLHDFKDGRKSMKIDPRDFGYCRKLTMPTHMNATCGAWRLKTVVDDFRGM
jgi:hypothetical protein